MRGSAEVFGLEVVLVLVLMLCQGGRGLLVDGFGDGWIVGDNGKRVGSSCSGSLARVAFFWFFWFMKFEEDGREVALGRKFWGLTERLFSLSVSHFWLRLTV